MCDPVTATLVAVSVITTGAGIMQQNAMAKAQTKAIKQQQAINREEVRQQATGELFDDMRNSRREQAKIRTAAGEAGLGLNSGAVEGMLNDSAMQMELQGDRTIANMESRHNANEAEAASMLSQIKKDSVLSAGIKIAGSAASAWAGSPNAAKITR